MSLDERREPILVTGFPRHALTTIVILAVAWEALSHLAPLLGIPPFAIPSLTRIARSLATVTWIDVAVTLARVLGALVISFLLGLGLAMCMYRSSRLEHHLRPLIRLLMAVPVISWILFAVLWFRGVEFRIAFVLVGGVRPGLPHRHPRCHARRAARAAPYVPVVPADPGAVLPQADGAGNRAR